MTSPAPSTGSWLPWVQPSVQAMPLTTDPAFIGHQFKYDGTRYTIYRKTANKRGGTSWIWRWGTEVRKEGAAASQKVGWLCCICWDKKVIYPVGTSSTTPAATHLREKHCLNSDGAIEDPAPSVLDQQQAAAEKQNAKPSTFSKHLVTQTDVNAFKQALLRWIVLACMALNTVENDAFRLMIKLLNPGIFEYLYKSHNSIKKMLLSDFELRKKAVREELANSISKIHISFDLWTSPSSSKLAMMGVVAHYVTKDHVARSLLIGFKSLIGEHTGENQAACVYSILGDMKIASKKLLGYFISDNASPNDTGTEELCRLLDIENWVHRRLRCLGHIINLAAKALLNGKDEDSIDFEVDSASAKIEVRQAMEWLEFWRKKGPIGKLHNIVYWIHATPQRVQKWKLMTTHMEEVAEELHRLNRLAVIRDNKTRWNSTFMSITRAILLRERFEMLFNAYDNELKDDRLTDEDWRMLVALERILEPFYKITKHLEGRATTGTHGAAWEALPSIEILIKHLDAMKKEYTAATHPELANSINVAWCKLDDYYIKLDESPVYAAALACHPSFRTFYFDTQWTGRLKKYVVPTKRAIKELYNSQYRPKDALTEEEEEKDYFDAIMDEQFNPKIGDQWKHYTEKDGRTMGRPDNVFHFWRDNGKHLPAVQQMAYDLLAIPAMSSEVERAFSGAKNTLDDKRTKLGPAVFEATELEKHWMKAGLGDDLGPSGYLSGYLTSDGKEVRPEALWGNLAEIYNVPKFTPTYERQHPTVIKDQWAAIEKFGRHIREEVVGKLLVLIAIILELPEDYFLKQHRYEEKSDCHLRYMKYHSRPADINAQLGGVWVKGHTDFGSLTLLFRQPVAALQVRTPSEEWKYVKPYPGSITVNIADSLSFLTNGFLKSSIHRVVAPPPDQAHLDRLGVLYFVRPEDVLELRPVDSPVMKRLGYTKAGEGEGMTAGEWVKARVKTNVAKGSQTMQAEQEIMRDVKAKYYD